MRKRDFLKILGGGTILAVAPGCTVLRPTPERALAPWAEAGAGYADPRKRALSWAILAPNPHNRQPWVVDLGEPERVTLYVDTARQLPATDPNSRQITIGLGCFVELMALAAAADGHAVTVTPFPEGADPNGALDGRPVATATFRPDPAVRADPLFAHALARRSVKEPFDVTRDVSANVVDVARAAAVHGTVVDGTVDPGRVAALRALTSEALNVEIDMPRAHEESVDLFRIGRREVEANPDGIDFSGRFFETAAALGLFSRDAARTRDSSVFRQGREAVLENTETAMAHVWLVTATNERADRLNAGRDWLRLHLATTPTGVAVHPIGQALQEYPEMASLYGRAHAMLAPEGGTVQMLARLGHAAPVPPSPRWSLDAVLARAVPTGAAPGASSRSAGRSAVR